MNANNNVTLCACNDCKGCARHSFSDTLIAVVTADYRVRPFRLRQVALIAGTAILVAERRTKQNDVMSLTAHVQCRTFRQLCYVLHRQKNKTTASGVQLVVLAKD
jgi:hypothetical protein